MQEKANNSDKRPDDAKKPADAKKRPAGTKNNLIMQNKGSEDYDKNDLVAQMKLEDAKR
ncbi:5858_t:CDS:2 [Cetraspora pellucida]|uniref:5858_t:CDS:1 n=1 Tax=Cetraspora pellucida TaxID=1433469 RepID=A0ACA9M7M7_9GLOM|nr:5858_t:CDS:2 [Cetraspora pellucida]